jgi:hypothetical protein
VQFKGNSIVYYSSSESTVQNSRVCIRDVYGMRYAGSYRLRNTIRRLRSRWIWGLVILDLAPGDFESWGVWDLVLGVLDLDWVCQFWTLVLDIKLGVLHLGLGTWWGIWFCA